MKYNFICKNCNFEQVHILPASDYDLKITSDGLLLETSCEKCGSCTLYRNIVCIPEVLGGSRGYMSLEKYWSKNPGLRKDLENKLSSKRKKK